MRKRMMRFAAVLSILASATGTASASSAGCPGNIVIGGTMACHTGGGGDCSRCTYRYDDGKSYTWNMCAQT
jgi:hypothetical protein